LIWWVFLNFEHGFSLQEVLWIKILISNFRHSKFMHLIFDEKKSISTCSNFSFIHGYLTPIPKYFRISATIWPHCPLTSTSGGSTLSWSGMKPTSTESRRHLCRRVGFGSPNSMHVFEQKRSFLENFCGNWFTVTWLKLEFSEYF
jgi:hypothetical protein